MNASLDRMRKNAIAELAEILGEPVHLNEHGAIILNANQRARLLEAVPAVHEQPTGFYFETAWGVPIAAEEAGDHSERRVVSLSTPPADDVREAAEAAAEALYPMGVSTSGWSYEDAAEYQGRHEGFIEGFLVGSKVRPHGAVTEDERAAINAALIRGLPLWVSAMEEGHARKALLDGIVHALEAAREVHRDR